MRIRNNDDLEMLEGYLHDSLFQKDSIKYYSDRNELVLDTTRLMWEKCITRKVFFIYRYYVPLIKCRLKFRSVLDFQIIQKENADHFVFLGIEAKENNSIIDIGSVYGPALRLKIKEIDGEVEDIVHASEEKVIRYGFRLFRNKRFTQVHGCAM